MIFNFKIAPYVKIPPKIEYFFGSYLIYDKDRKEHPHVYNDFSEGVVNYVFIAIGESLKFVFRVFVLVIAKLKINFGITVKGTEKYFD